MGRSAKRKKFRVEFWLKYTHVMGCTTSLQSSGNRMRIRVAKVAHRDAGFATSLEPASGSR